MPNEINYNQNFYIKLDWKPPRFSKEIEDRLDSFEVKAHKLQKATLRHEKQSNRSEKSNEFITFMADKTLGALFTEPETYNNKSWD
ncbi:hypothetical protein ACHAWF_011371 [Thalassiosira exigua]